MLLSNIKDARNDSFESLMSKSWYYFYMCFRCCSIKKLNIHRVLVKVFVLIENDFTKVNEDCTLFITFSIFL